MSDLENIHANLRRASELALPEGLMAAHEDIVRANYKAADVLDGATHQEALDVQAQLGDAADKLNEAIELLDEARGRIVDMEIRLCIGKAINIEEIVDIFRDDPVTAAINQEVREVLEGADVPDNPLGIVLDGLDVEAVIAADDEDFPVGEPELVREDDVVHVYEAEDGTVVKFVKPSAVGTPEEKEQSAIETLRGMVASLNVGKGVPGLEQIIASNEELKVVVSEAVPGMAIKFLSDPDLEEIPDEHIDRLVTTFQQMQMRSLEIDYGVQGDTIVYDLDEGFTITSYEHVVVILKDDEFYQRQRIEEKLAHLFSIKGLLSNHPPHRPVPPAAIRFRDLCARRLGAYVGEAINKRWTDDNLLFG